MNPNILGVIGPGFLNQVPTLGGTRFAMVLGIEAVGVEVRIRSRSYPKVPHT